MLHEPGFKPEKDYSIESLLVTGGNAAQLYEKYRHRYDHRFSPLRLAGQGGNPEA